MFAKKLDSTKNISFLVKFYDFIRTWKKFFSSTCSILSLSLALLLRFDFSLEPIRSIEGLYKAVFILLIIRFYAYRFWSIHEGFWRYFSINELKNVVYAHFISSVCFIGSLHLFSIHGFPRSVVIIEFCISIVIVCSALYLSRKMSELSSFANVESSSAIIKDTIVIGAGNSGHLFLKTSNFCNRYGYQAIGVLDDDERLQGFNIHGIKVIGKIADLDAILQKFSSVSAVIVAIPTLGGNKYNEIKQICTRKKVTLKRLQSFENIAIENGITSVEDILDREVTVENESEIRDALAGKRVLVTGAGGSIGSEIIRQILPFEPSMLILLDVCEYNLFRMELECSEVYPNISKRFVIGNICDELLMDKLFREEKPEIIFHAAAYKHVPLMETNSSQAFINNVFGTKVLLEVSAKYKAQKFVLISTDKAIEPSSVMGCTKRIAELLVRQSSQDKFFDLNACAVRFGNVINSTGSVIPLFREQILSGGSVKVTHPDMERYFMSIQEAVRLVLTAGTLGVGGEIYVLDMGKKIKILDIARKMINLYGRPNIPIVFTGLRPGEKLSEKIQGKEEQLSKTRFNKVSRLDDSEVHNDIFNSVNDLKINMWNYSDQEIAELLRSMIE